MAVMGRQQLQRLKAWRTELKRHLCVPVIRLAFEGFVTMERLKREEAEQHERAPGSLTPKDREVALKARNSFIFLSI